MNKILLPTDFSKGSITAIDYALKFFKDDVCEFNVLNVQKVSSFVSDDLMAMQPSETIFNSLISAAKERISALIKDLETRLENPLHTFTAHVDYDNFIDAINQQVALNKVDLIVMGTKGESNIHKRIFGSNTIRVIQRCSCPVLVIPEAHTYSKLKTIAFTSNYYTAYNTDDLLPLLKIVERKDCKVHIIHVRDGLHLTDNQEDNRALLDAQFKGVKHSFSELKEGDLFHSVMRYISKNNIDFLAMMSRKHSFLERLFITHPAERFTFDLKVPLLVMENTVK